MIPKVCQLNKLPRSIGYTPFSTKKPSTCKAIVPYAPTLFSVNPAFTKLPALHGAFHYIVTAPRQDQRDLIYHIQEHDSPLLDVSLYEDFKQNKHFFSVHFKPTDKGIQFYKNTVKRIIELESPYNYTYQPHFGKVEIAIEIEQPNVMNGRRVIRPIHLSANTSLFLEKKPTK